MILVSQPCVYGTTYSLTANIRMPDFGFKLHKWRPERIVGGNLDVNLVSTTFVGSIRGSWEDSSKVCHIILPADWLRRNLRVGIGMDVGQFLGDAPSPIASHCVS